MKALLALALASTALVGCVGADARTVEDGDATPVVTPALNGDTWTTVDDLPYTAGHGADYTGVAVAPNGKVWVVGYRTESNFDETWLVRVSTNNGASFGFNSAFTYDAGGAAVPNSIWIDAANRIFITGWVLDANQTTHWITRRSIDDGASWQTVDDWLPANSQTTGASVMVDDSGVVYAGGGVGQNGESFWKIRRSTDHGVTWSQADVVDEGAVPGIGAVVNGMCEVGGTLFAVGSHNTTTDPDPLSAWQVRSSTTGTTWGQKENWAPAHGHAIAFGCGGFPGGALYVAGQDRTSAGVAHWIVQRSANGGALTTVDDLAPGTDIDTAFAVREGDAGTIYAAGVVGLHWRVRKTTDGTAWVSSDDFSLAGGSAIAQAQAIRYSSALGHTFVAGMATDATGREHGIVRRR